ncbi:MAG: efflux RND transporter permease subunit [cyanobacterium endosymbiont of Rhopalodia musculus]|uniref:efflux RND transporter permease subunit n=1 Tax=cyanobacterium endosymbiont of Epithemia clementina EcSB TaxID=3034674 RepID=UPI00247FC814|nr:efflux RND transporter permease subunit [cyanobacterium endosymbiont of Epithemia clementina EcSB]WGT66946.1 efflux RND transporter permease subunit [cyanobacterium endosymbiont of Epithemia clementina EcSB]
MFVNFFIKRPVFSTVCALIIFLVGSISLFNLPIERFPDISPTKIQVRATYSGANAEVVENAVTSILERQINGVEGLKYLTSSSSNSGTSNITAVFNRKKDKDLAAVDVQNQVSIVQSRLPEDVQRTGIQVTKDSNNLLLGVGLFSDNNQYNNIFISNYTDRYLVDSLKRLNGVGNVRIFGERRYSMRLWLDPVRLAGRGLTTQDVVDALSKQNLQVGVGKIGGEPAPPGQEYQLDLRAVSQLKNPEEFNDLLLKTDENGALIRFKDVGRAQLGAEDYGSFLRFRGQSAVGIGIYPSTGANALEVAKKVKTEMNRLATFFPPGLQYTIAFDTTQFIEESLAEVVKTMLIAVILVILVILLFLQNWRTTLIPALTIPLALIGTFAFVKVFDFSINSLTLFGLTLATGIVVDDAIIVVEQISKYIEDEDVPPQKAASKAMGELSGAVIVTSLVLMAVFVPVAFFSGTTGALYRQFALTIAFSIVISTFLALTLTPSLCGLILRRGQGFSGWVGAIFAGFNRILDWVTVRYRRLLLRLSHLKSLVVGVFILLIGVTTWLYFYIPTSFIPDEDQGYFITLIQGTEGVSLQYTSKVISKIEKIILAQPEVQATFTLGGFSFSGNSTNSGVIFSPLKPFAERKGPKHSAQTVIGRLWGAFSQIPEAQIIPINPPAIQGLGNFGGFTFQLQDLGGSDNLNDLVGVMIQFLEQANQKPDLTRVFSRFSTNTPQLLIEINRNKAHSLQVSIDDIFSTLQTALGSRYVNDFSLQQRTYRVYVQSDQQFRSNPDDVKQLYVRSATNQMIPLSNLVTITPSTGAQTISHYNLYRSVEINGSATSGVSSGQAIKTMENTAKQVLPQGFGYEWSGTSLEEIESGGLAPTIFSLGLLFVFLVLAAQYENYVDPLIIILSVPLAILGALTAQWLRGLSNDVYCQIGLVMLIGLASKNAILIVEFANRLRDQGLSIVKAAVEAAQERLRPILMTACSTLLGTFPLVVATGAGSGSRQSLGTAVFGGMLIASFLSLFLVPILYIVIKIGIEEFLSHKQ